MLKIGNFIQYGGENFPILTLLWQNDLQIMWIFIKGKY